MILKLLALAALAMGVGFAPCLAQDPVDCKKPPTNPKLRKAWEEQCKTVLIDAKWKDASGPLVMFKDSGGLGGGPQMKVPQMKVMKAMLTLRAFDLASCRLATDRRILTCNSQVDLELVLGRPDTPGTEPVISLPR